MTTPSEVKRQIVEALKAKRITEDEIAIYANDDDEEDWAYGVRDGQNGFINFISLMEFSNEPASVYEEIKAEGNRAEAKFPNQHLPNFPALMDWRYAAMERDQAQELTDRCHKEGHVTWWHILREEVYEAFAESDVTKLRAELIQVATMAVRWIEDLDRDGSLIESAPVLVTKELDTINENLRREIESHRVASQSASRDLTLTNAGEPGEVADSQVLTPSAPTPVVTRERALLLGGGDATKLNAQHTTEGVSDD